MSKASDPSEQPANGNRVDGVAFGRRVAELLGSGPLAGLHLLEAEIRECLSEPFAMRLLCRSEVEAQDADALIGHEVVLRIPLHDRDRRRHRWLHGLVAEVSVEYSEIGDVLYAIEARPHVWFLDHVQDCRIFQDLSVVEIVSQLCGEHGVPLDATLLNERYAAREFCVQYNETTLGFIRRLLGEEGIAFHFTHSRRRHTMVLADGPVSYEQEAALPELRVHAGGAGQRSGEERAWSLREVSRHRPREFTSTDYNFEQPRDNLLVIRRDENVPVVGRAQVFDYPGEYLHYDRGDELARVRLEQLRRDVRRTIFETDARGIAHGTLLRLHPASTHVPAREILVVETRTSLVCDYGRTTETEDDRPAFRASVVGVDAKQRFRPPWPRRAVLVDGPQTATVVGPEGEEIYTDNYGRVKVQFHWDRYGEHDHNSSCWVRSSQPWAGKGWGGIQIPRIGQEVIVDFIDGDPDRPIITGRVYNAASMPPVSNAGRDGEKGEATPPDMKAAAMQMTLRSNSLGHSGGHNEITMHDEGGKEKLFIRAQKDEIHNVLNDRKDTVGNDEVREVGNDRSRAVGNDEMVVIGANETRQVGENQSISVGQSIVIDAGTSITLVCGASRIHMNQAGFITISGTVINIAGAINCNMVAPITSVTGGIVSMNTGGVANVIASGGPTAMLSGGPHTITSGAKASVGAPKIDINGADQVAIDGGSLASIVGGSVKIN